MVEQANNNTGSLVDYFKAMKRGFGSWLAMAETKERVKQNLIPQDQYRRTVSHDFLWADWSAAHKWGQDFRRMYNENSDALPDLTRRRPSKVGNKAMSKLLTMAMNKRVKVSSRSDATEPVWYKCACCSRLMNYGDQETTLDGDHLVCHLCRDNDYIKYSNCMGGWIMEHNAVRVFHDANEVDSDDYDYATILWCQENGYHRRNGRFYSDEALDAYGEAQGIYGYHSGPDLPKIASPEYDKRKPRVLLGMELEVENIESEGDENVDNEEIAKSIYKAVGKVVKNYMKCERDGSLDNGFEIITAPTGLDIHAKALAQLQHAAHRDQIHSHSTDTCGLHVHVCKAGMTTLHAAKLQQFINSEQNEALVRCVARRYQKGSSGYAKITQGEDWLKHMGRIAGPAYRNAREAKRDGWGNGRIDTTRLIGAEFVHDRYSALNFRNDHTVEFRLFRGTLKFESIMACLEFAYACWFFSKEAPINGLTTEAFMKFITRAENRKDTKHLRAYLKAKKFRAFYQAEQIARPKFKDATPRLAEETMLLSEEPTHVYVGERDRRPAAARVAA